MELHIKTPRYLQEPREKIRNIVENAHGLSSHEREVGIFVMSRSRRFYTYCVEVDRELPRGDEKCSICGLEQCTWASLYVTSRLALERARMVTTCKMLDLPDSVIAKAHRERTWLTKSRVVNNVFRTWVESPTLLFGVFTIPGTSTRVKMPCTFHHVDVDGLLCPIMVIPLIRSERHVITLLKLATHPMFEIVDSDGEIVVLSPSSTFVHEKLCKIVDMSEACTLKCSLPKVRVHINVKLDRLGIVLRKVNGMCLVKNVLLFDGSSRSVVNALLVVPVPDRENYVDVFGSCVRVIVSL